MQAAGKIPELLERAGQPIAYLVRIGADVERHPVADTAQHEQQGHQALLDAVVQVPFDSAAHLIAHGEDPAAGGGQLGRELTRTPPGRGPGGHLARRGERLRYRRQMTPHVRSVILISSQDEDDYAELIAGSQNTVASRIRRRRAAAATPRRR